MISNIVFTKNRPLQLHAYLESFYRYFPSGLIQTYIIYKEELFGGQYETLFRQFADCIVIKEEDFHSDFLKLLDRINTKFILFGVDDVVYFDSVDFEIIDKAFSMFPEDIFGFSLRFSKKIIRDSNDPVSETVVAGQNIYSINWKRGRTPNTRYPFELCATIYPTNLVKKVVNNTQNNNPLVRKLFSPSSSLIRMLRKVKSPRSILSSFGYFYCPNMLESWVCRWCQYHNEKLPSFLYFQRLCASAIQVNIVNTSTNNETNGSIEHTVEALNEKYRKGYRLDIDFVAKNKPTGTHCGLEYFQLRNNHKSKCY